MQSRHTQSADGSCSIEDTAGYDQSSRRKTSIGGAAGQRINQSETRTIYAIGGDRKDRTVAVYAAVFGRSV
jgi:hypothetical protein